MKKISILVSLLFSYVKANDCDGSENGILCGFNKRVAIDSINSNTNNIMDNSGNCWATYLGI